MVGMNLASPRYLITEAGMTKFDQLCARMPIVDTQRALIESGRTGDPMTKATAEYVLAKKETPQGDLIGTNLALNFVPNRS